MYDVERLRRAASEYEYLRAAGSVTQQVRGQRFNETVAEVLRSWGVAAETSVRGTGELDVVFAIDGARYIMEVKWEANPADTGRIAKLQKRVRQRILGTYGVFLSMSGYSRPALADVADGERLEVLLLDASHFEAMISGIVSPTHLLSLVHDQAAFRGRAYTPMADLLSARGAIPQPPPPFRQEFVDDIAEPTQSPELASSIPAEIFVFSGHQAIYWVIVALLGLLSVLLAAISFIPPELSFWKLVGGVVTLFLVALTGGFVQLARHPARLIIGPRGIQFITRQGTTWLPWGKAQSVAIRDVYGGPHVVVKTPDAPEYPTISDGVGIRPRYVPQLDAVILCPINVLRAAPWQISHALYSYAGPRMTSA